MLRITKKTIDGEGELITLEGKLVGPWVDEFRHVVDDAATHRKLDLSALSFADTEGIRLLQEMVQQGATLTDRTSFVASLLTKVLP